MHHVIVRHGPVPVLDRLFPKYISESCRPKAENLNDLTRYRQYEPSFLDTPPLRARKQHVQFEHDIATRPLTAKTYLSVPKADEGAAAPSAAQEKAQAAVTARAAEAPPAAASLNKVPFLVAESVETEEEPAFCKGVTRAGAPLRCGTAILNVGDPGRPASDLGFIGRGTLGCFVRLLQPDTPNSTAALTTASALGGRRAKVGHEVRVVCGRRRGAANGGPSRSDRVGEILRLKLPVASAPRARVADDTVDYNRFEAALVALDSDNFKPDVKEADRSAPRLRASLRFQTKKTSSLSSAEGCARSAR